MASLAIAHFPSLIPKDHNFYVLPLCMGMATRSYKTHLSAAGLSVSHFDLSDNNNEAISLVHHRQ